MTARFSISSLSLAALGSGLFVASACSQAEPSGFVGASSGGDGGAASGSSAAQGGGSTSASSSSSGSFVTYGGGSSSSARPVGGSSGGAAASSSTTASSQSGSGASATTGASSSAAAGSSSSAAGGACAVTSIGGLPLTGSMMNYLGGADAGPGPMGYAFAFGDFKAPATGMSTACLAPGRFCGSGTTAASNISNWGAGIGANVNQAAATGAASPPANGLALTATGLQYALSSLPTQTLYITLTANDAAATVYYYTATAASGTVPWARFVTTPWTTPNTPFPTTQSVVSVGFQLSAGATATPFDFCVTSLAFK